ncbi:ABC transporter permease [Clostridia bacterium]|nr:ABC transporter permease [Clostridia bacterium]
MFHKLRGTKCVFRFSYVQQLKSRAFIIGTLIMNGFFVAILLITNFANVTGSATTEPVNNIETSKSDVSVSDTIKKVYYVDSTALELDCSDIAHKYDVVFANSGVPEQPNDNEIVVVISTRDYGYDVVTKCGGGVSEIAANTLSESISDAVKDKSNEAAGLTPDMIKAANATVTMSVVSERGNIGISTNSALQRGLRTMVASVLALIMFMFVIIYGQLVGQSVAMEKTSKVIEMLLVSVKPLAVIVGKVLAMGAAAFTQIIATVAFQFVIAFAIAPLGALSGIGAALTAHNFTPTTTSERFISNFSYVLSYVNAGTICASILTFLLGYLFYAMLSGLAASCISRQEDLQAAMQPMAFTGLLGLYLAYILPSMSLVRRGASASFLMKLSYYLPVSSPFALPGAILTGEVSGFEIPLAIAVLTAFDVLFALFVARVYHHTILHSGERIKLIKLLKFSFVR